MVNVAWRDAVGEEKPSEPHFCAWGGDWKAISNPLIVHKNESIAL